MRYSLRDIGFVLASVTLAVASGLGTAEPYKRPGVWFFGMCAVVLSLQAWKRQNPPAKQRVEFDDQEIRSVSGNDTKVSIRWDELHEIHILTTGGGPAADDVFWMFLNADREGCWMSNSAEGFPALLARIQTLPEFDNEAVVQAMGSAVNNTFIVWRAQ